MFTLTDTPVKFIGLLILFAFTTLWSVREVTQPQTPKQRVSNVLHLAMAVVMLLMVARTVWVPVRSVITLPVLTGIFVVFTLWFGYMIVDAARARAAGRPTPLGHYISHALMFAAMAWHLWAMALMASMMTHGPGHGEHGGHDMHDAMTPMQQASEPGGSLWIIALIGIPFMLYLLAASLLALAHAVAPARTVTSADREPIKEPALAGAGAPVVVDAPVPVANTCHEPRPIGSVTYRLGAAAEFAMLFGMFWMSTGLLTPIAPFMSMLAF